MACHSLDAKSSDSTHNLQPSATVLSGENMRLLSHLSIIVMKYDY